MLDTIVTKGVHIVRGVNTELKWMPDLQRYAVAYTSMEGALVDLGVPDLVFLCEGKTLPRWFERVCEGGAPDRL